MQALRRGKNFNYCAEGAFRVEPVGYPTSSPTDPDERLSRIRFLRETVLLRRPSDIS